MTSLELVQAQIRDHPSLVLPITGEIVDLTEPVEVARALETIDEATNTLRELKALLVGAIRLEAQRQGTKTLHLDGADVIISGGPKTEYDAFKLQLLFRELGVPEDRIAQAVVEEISYKPNAAVLKQMAGANEAYADAIEACKTTVEGNWYARVKR